jgi:hypothetical protein
MNIEFLKSVPGYLSSKRLRPDLSGLEESRTETVIEHAQLFYSKEEVKQAASNRRSKNTDEAVISDFMSFEHAYHQIPEDEHFTKALAVTRDIFNPGTLYTVHYCDLRYYPWNLKPSAEAPWTLEDFTFKPTFRSVDDESETPKLREHIEKLSYWISEGKISVKDYLRSKHRFGLISDTNHSFHNLYNEIFNYNRSLIHFIKDGLHPYWDGDTPVPYYWNTLHARSHVVSKDEPDKIRAVFGAPKLLLMAENMFIWPMQKAYLNDEKLGRMLWGRETIRGGWKKLYSEVHTHGLPETILSLDWSEFDKRLLFKLMDFVHLIWRSYFDFSRYQPTSFNPNATTDPTRLERLWNWTCHSIKHNPILLPNGDLYKWKHNGFGSGYQRTQVMDSFANCIMILTCLSKLGVNISHPTFWIRVQGDDSLIAFYENFYTIYGPSFLTMIGDAALYYFNAKLNVKKSQLSYRLDGISVLGYFNSYGLPYRTDEDLLRHLMFPETPGPQEQLLAAAIGLLYSSCGCSYQFYKLCKHIIDKLRTKGKLPDPRSLRWMVRAQIIEPDEIESMMIQPLPSYIELKATSWMHQPRSEAQKERIWPTKPGTRERFFFLNPV